MLLNDREIRELCKPIVGKPMIHPFHAKQVTSLGPIKLISSGLSSVGYDIHLGPKIKTFLPPYFNDQQSAPIDPKNFDMTMLHEFEVDQPAPNNFFILPPGGYCLGNTPEWFNMPVDVAAICLTKSTYARCGLLVNVTPLEPEWEGHLTLEIANLTPRPMKIYVNEGIAQLMFLKTRTRPEITYADRGGKYQGQGDEPVMPRMK